MDIKAARYTGEFVNMAPHGRGETLERDGSRFEGEFRNGTRFTYVPNAQAANGAAGATSPGKEFNADGTLRYEGEFAAGVAHGAGRYFLADGSRYEGHMRDGQMTGVGKLFKVHFARLRV